MSQLLVFYVLICINQVAGGLVGCSRQGTQQAVHKQGPKRSGSPCVGTEGSDNFYLLTFLYGSWTNRPPPLPAGWRGPGGFLTAAGAERSWPRSCSTGVSVRCRPCPAEPGEPAPSRRSDCCGTWWLPWRRLCRSCPPASGARSPATSNVSAGQSHRRAF